ncbi:unnamed protein product [Aphanomyces euteiches]|uniref:Aquaporin n=1 Tax=Aphanomyces euteiches TaxID=100861 RepID=A0A6G0WYL4_9STRA|nr:hypothetical protein Ae201684_010294 [Aphanomyces euteiches]KAH9090671.1 hypothetical protein Ae201684P_014466 [Aphanomyces euteiches]KAH9112412.1 hypothetical protein AeMF1_013253 [Aphanomyces euteiches]KAH9142987.1 hypothetical protein AeRB84_012981 [Aphanomyces euteiches]KAH9161045.1 hypothetical protein LEN26_001601 [Aphanomyces euteiches]
MINDYKPMDNVRENGKGEKVYPWWRIRSHFARECLAEVAGTFIMLLFIDGVVAQVVLGENKKGDYTHISIGCGLAVMLGIHASGGVSGAHLNPAISIALAVYGRFPWKKVPFYILSQMVGAFLGALFVFIVYYPAFNTFDPERTVAKSAGIFATYPMSWEYQGSAFVCEMLGTALLMFTIFSVDDPTNMPTNPIMKPITVGLIVVMIGMSFGMPTGYALNPARDLGPRIFTAIAGWGSAVFTADNHYFWIPICAPIVGAILGGGAYIAIISNHHDEEDDFRASFVPEMRVSQVPDFRSPLVQ